MIQKIVNNHLLVLSFIILLGLFLRIYQLTSVPAGFFCDEADIGYNAYTISQVGKDEYGIPYPIFFRGFGEYKSPIEIYSTVPFVYFFGLNEFTTRLPSALYGTVGIVALYLLMNELFNKNKHKRYLALFAAFLLAISPWDIQFSRVAFELMPFICFTLLGVWTFLQARERPLSLYFAAFFFVFAIYSYSDARIFIPLLLVTLACLYYQILLKNSKITIFAILIGTVLLLPIGIAIKNGDIFARFQQVSIFAQPPSSESITQHILQNYTSALSPDFLFFKGDIGMPGEFVTRHSVKGIGELYLWQLPFILLGILFLLIKKQWRISILLLAWILFYPTGSMLTTNKSALATETIIGVIPWQIVTTLGVYFIMILLKRKLLRFAFIFLCSLVILFSYTQYMQLYFVAYPTYSSDFWGWQYGAKDIVNYFADHEKEYDQLVMAPEFNAPDIFFRFYAPHNCQKCIIGLPENNFNPKLRQLFAVTPTYIAQHPEYHFQTLQTISYPNHTIAFLITQIVQ